MPIGLLWEQQRLPVANSEVWQLQDDIAVCSDQSRQMRCWHFVLGIVCSDATWRILAISGRMTLRSAQTIDTILLALGAGNDGSRCYLKVVSSGCKCKLPWCQFALKLYSPGSLSKVLNFLALIVHSEARLQALGKLLWAAAHVTHDAYIFKASTIYSQ